MIVGLTSGTWDLLHQSHTEYLEECKKQCDKLIVGIDSNRMVKEAKGPKRPIHDERHRWNLLLNQSHLVDIAFILDDVADLTKIAYDFGVQKVFKCERFLDFDHVFGTEHAELVIIPDTPNKISTSEIIRRIQEGISEPIRARD